MSIDDFTGLSRIRDLRSTNTAKRSTPTRRLSWERFIWGSRSRPSRTTCTVRLSTSTRYPPRISWSSARAITTISVRWTPSTPSARSARSTKCPDPTRNGPIILRAISYRFIFIYSFIYLCFKSNYEYYNVCLFVCLFELLQLL